MKIANYSHPTRLFYLLLACTLSGMGLFALFATLPNASAAKPPEVQVQDTATSSLPTANPYTPTLEFVSSMGGDHGDIVLAGDYAYVGNGAELSVVDISDPSLAHEVRLLCLPGVIHDLAVDSNYLYIAAGYGGLLIYDIGTPAAPKQLNRLQDEFPYYYVHPAGNLLIAITSNSFKTLDVSQPVAPQLLDELEGDYLPENQLFVHGSFAYLEYQIFDLTDPTALSVAASLDGIIREVHEPYAVVGTVSCYDYYSCLCIYDITNPATPVRLGDYIMNSLVGARIEGDRLYTTNNYDMEIFDISNGLSLLGAYLTSGSTVEVSSNRVYILGNGLEIVDTSDPANPVLLDSYTTPDSVMDYGRSGDVFFLHMLYQVNYEDRFSRSLHILDAADPSNIAVLGPAIPFTGLMSVYEFRLDGERGYLSFFTPKFQIWDFSNISAPRYLGGHRVTDFAPPIKIQSTAGRAYLSGMIGPLKIMDTSDPSQPTVLMQYPLLNSDEYFQEAGRVISDSLVQVYVIKYDPLIDDIYLELQLVDFSAAPDYTVLGRYHVGAPHYFSDTFEGNSTSSPAPSHLSSPQVLTNAFDGTSTHAYIGQDNGVIEIVDTSNPSSPTFISTYISTGTLISLRIADDLLYAGYDGKLEIIDVSDPYSPTLLSLTPISATICNITVADGWAYLSTEYRWWGPRYAGLFIYNVSDPAKPILYQHYPISTYNVQVVGGLAYLSTVENGLQILSLFEPSIYFPFIQYTERTHATDIPLPR
jgi:hypothetical protein